MVSSDHETNPRRTISALVCSRIRYESESHWSARPHDCSLADKFGAVCSIEENVAGFDKEWLGPDDI
jgi:hypothetical protein